MNACSPCPICGRPIDVGQISAVVDTDDLDLLALDLGARVLAIVCDDVVIYAACIHTTERTITHPSRRRTRPDNPGGG